MKRDYQVDTVVPLKKNMNAYQDMLGLTRLKDFPWEPYQRPYATRRDQTDRPKHPTLVKRAKPLVRTYMSWTVALHRELKRQQTLAKKKGLPPPQPLPQPQTLLGIARGVTSWTDCPVPLTVVINREIDRDGTVDDWVLGTTSATFSAGQIRSNYTLRIRTAIEERHRQYRRKS